MVKILLMLFAPVGVVLASSAVAQTPVPCLKAGLNQKTFESDFAESSAFDENASFEPGYKWYRWNWFGIDPDHKLVSRQSDGSISAQGGFQGHLVSAAKSVSPAGFVGTAFGGGACIEFIVRFSNTRGKAGNGHPSLWAMSKEHLDGSGDDQWPGMAPGFSHFAEWDILEYYKVPPPGFLSSWIDWYGPYIKEGSLRVEGKDCHRPYCKEAGSFAFPSKAIPSNTDWEQWQKIIGVWTPAGDGKQGCIQTFFNNVSLAEPHCWNSPDPDGNAPLGGLNFSIIDQHHMVLVLSSGDSPISVRSVKVYQKDGKHNLVN